MLNDDQNNDTALSRGADNVLHSTNQSHQADALDPKQRLHHPDADAAVSNGCKFYASIESFVGGGCDRGKVVGVNIYLRSLCDVSYNSNRNLSAMTKEMEAASLRIPYWRQVIDKAGITPAVEDWDYEGSGTHEDPYVVAWTDNDPRNPMNYSMITKWSITLLVGFATLAVAFVSSAFSGGVESIIAEFECSQEVVTLGLSLFVLGFAIGPLLWAPLSEMLGRQVLFIGTYAALTAFNAGAAGSQNIGTLIVLRFFAGAFGSSPLTNAGGVIADMFPAKQRGLAMAIFAAAPFLGPVIGPIVGGFVGETVGKCLRLKWYLC